MKLVTLLICHFKGIFPIEILETLVIRLLKFLHKGLIYDKLSLVQVKAWWQIDNKPSPGTITTKFQHPQGFVYAPSQWETALQCNAISH